MNENTNSRIDHLVRALAEEVAALVAANLRRVCPPEDLPEALRDVPLEDGLQPAEPPAEPPAESTAKKPAVPSVLVAEWPDGSRVTFGPFVDGRDALRARVKAKEWLRGNAPEAIWSVVPVDVCGMACDVQASDL